MVRSIFLRFVSAFLYLLLFPGISLAWTPGLLEAAQAVAFGRGTPAQEIMVFLNNREINLMAQEGRLTDMVYASCQDQFFQLNDKLVKQAVRDAGFEPNISEAKLNPGTDTDVNVTTRGGQKLTLDDIKKVEGNYQMAVRQHIASKGVPQPPGRIDTNTDFMPHPANTTPDEFQKIVNHVNQNGGTAYTDPKAASAQSKLGTAQKINLDEASSFSATMKDMASGKIDKANGLRAEANRIRASDPGRAEMLQAQAAQYDYQAAKYHERLSKLNQQVRSQYGLPEKTGASAMDDAAAQIAKIGRNPYSAGNAATVRNLHQNALQRSSDDLIDAMLMIAKKDPSRLAEVRKLVAAEARTLPMNRAGQAMERLERAAKQIEAASKWTAFKNGARDLSGIKQMTKISVVMTAGGAILMGHEGVKVALNDVKATDTVWDFIKSCYVHSAWEGTGIGPAFEKAQREELERYIKEFENGANPSMVKHVTFTLLKTGVYMGQDVLIGVLYLPDTIWEYFTQEKEMEAYAAMQNELASVMHQMVLDRRAYEQMMTKMRKLGLHDEDVKPFLNCMCRNCGGMFGGSYNPSMKGEYGHGPCQCSGPLTIWKTPLPTSDTKTQYACFNEITKMRYDEAQDIFNKWHQQALLENARTVEKEVQDIKADVANRKAMEDEETARAISDKLNAIKGLMLPADLDYVRATVGPYLANHAARNIETGQTGRAIDNMDRVLKKIGPRSAQEEANHQATKRQYEQWDANWRDAQAKRFPPIQDMVQKNQAHRAWGELQALEYQMMKAQPRVLPPADKDPDYVALKARVEGAMKTYDTAVRDAWQKSSDFQKARDMRSAIAVLGKVVKDWEHPTVTAQGFERQLHYDRSELAKADLYKQRGQQLEEARNLAQAIENYAASLAIQDDDALEHHVKQLKVALADQQARYARAKYLREQGENLRQSMQLVEAIAAFRQSLELVPDPNLEQYIHTVEQQLALQQRRETAQRLRNEGSALEHDRKIREAIGKYQESLRYVPDRNLEVYIAALEKALLPRPQQTPQPTPQPQPVTVARVDVTGSWRHHAEGTWTITRASSGGWFAQESGLGNASGPGYWTSAGTFRIDYTTRDGTIKGYYDIGFAPDGRTGNGTVRELNGPMRTGNSHWERIGAAPTATDTASAPAPTGKPNVLYDNGNIGGVDNKPTRVTTFTINQTRTITKIVDYHWNNGRGTSQTGSIALRDAAGRTWGPWATSGSPGQGGVANAYWTATPNIQLPPGSYTVIDSDPATWAQNSESQGAGHTRIEGH